MKAARFLGPGMIRVEGVDIPRPGPGELVIKTRVALTCGTDVKAYKRGHPLAKPPIILGHEFSGVVSEVGEGVSRFREGMRVVAANTAPCNSCYFCKIGRQNLCERLEGCIIGFTYQGAYAEYVKVPSHIVEQNTHQIPDHVSFEGAAILEPLACVVHGMELASIGLGDEVVVMGAGPVGQLHLQLARVLGAKRVIVTDPHPLKLQKASSLGAEVTINIKDEDQLQRVKELTEGRGADLVLEATGKPEGWERAVQMCRKGGTVVFFGGCPPGATVSLDAKAIHYGELTLKGSFHHTPACVKRALDLISSGSVKVMPLITGKMTLEDVPLALESMAQGKALKIAILPSS